jgi:hypothetical protein
MKKREMLITIGPGGGVRIEVQGVPGADCLDFSKFLEEELGEVVERQRTAEYYQQAEEKRLAIQIGGGGGGEE